MTVMGASPLIRLILFCLMIIGVGACLAPSEAEAKPSLYMLVLDEFSLNSILDSRGQIDQHRFPNFARLAKCSVWYRNHVSAADVTPAAVSSILSGIQPVETSRAGSYQQSLFYLLRSSHQIRAMDEVVRFCVRPQCHNLANGQLSEQVGGLQVNSRAPRNIKSRSSTTTQARRLAWMINAIDNRSRPQLWFAHVGLPHLPWAYLNNGDQYFHMGFRYPGINSEGRWSSNRMLADLAQQRTIMQIQFVDLLLGQFINRLIEKKQWHQSMVIVTADHGASNHAGYHRRFLGPNNYSDIAGIPLLVKYPNQSRGRISSRATRAIDLLPTIASTLKIKTGRRFQGNRLEQAPLKTTLLMRNSRRHRLVAMSWAQFQAQRRRSLQYNQARFPYPSPLKTTALDRVQPEQISTTTAQRMAVTLDYRWKYKSVRAGSGWRPAVFATGHLHGIEADRSLLITVNGRPAGLATAFASQSKMRFAALLDGLQERDNQIDIYVRAGYKWLRLAER